MIQERSGELINTSFFAHTGIPESVAELDLVCQKKKQYILRMPVRVESSEYLIPTELNWLEEMFQISLIHQKKLNLDHPFCYITVRHGIVESQTDDEWHVDGFSTKVPHPPEQNYIWCSQTGTEYVPLQISFPKDFDPLIHNINNYLQRFVEDSLIDSCSEKTLYCLDPYILHRRPTCTSGQVRTFIRISFVPIEINDVNNTQNPLLPRIYTKDGVKLRNAMISY